MARARGSGSAERAGRGGEEVDELQVLVGAVDEALVEERELDGDLALLHRGEAELRVGEDGLEQLRGELRGGVALGEELGRELLQRVEAQRCEEFDLAQDLRSTGSAVR